MAAGEVSMVSAPLRGLRGRLVLLVLLSMVPTFVVVVGAALARRSYAVDEASEAALRAARAVADRQKRAFDEAAVILDVLARTQEVRSGTGDEAARVLAEVQRRNPLYANLGICREDGTFRTSVLPVPSGINALDRAWFRRALATDAFSVGEFQIGRITGKPTVNAAVVVDRGDGRRDVLFAAIDLGRLHEDAGRAALPRGASLQVVDPSGTILVDWPEGRSGVGGKAPPGPVTQAMMSGVAGTASGEDVEGVRRLYGHVAVRAGSVDPVAYVAVGIPEDGVVAAAEHTLYGTLGWMALVTVAGLVAAWCFGGILVVRRLDRLEKAASRLGSGDLAARVGPAYAGGEIGRLERSFDLMAEILEGEIHNRRRSEDALGAREELFRQMAETIEEVFWVSEPGEKPIKYVSPAFERIWGVPAERLYEDPRLWVEAIHPGDRRRVVEAIARGEESGTYDETYRVIRPDTTTRWIRDRAFPVRDAAGRIVRIFGIAEDITKGKDLEQQFQQVQKMEAVGRLAAGIAHDFNNVLTVISLYTRITADEVDEASKKNLQVVIDATDHAAALTRQLLAFSRKQVLAPEPLDLNEALKRTESMVRRLIGPGIELVTVPGRDLGKIHADPHQVQQVIMNLVVNARDAMPSGGRLTLEAYDVDVDAGYSEVHLQKKPGPYVVLSVTDSGVGMDEETRSRIFEPFFTTKGEGKGTGLGLSTVYGIVTQSGGDIFVYSEKGVGTSFKMYFPRYEGPAKPRVEAEPAAQVPLGPRTIVLVEDDNAIRRLVYALLRAQGHAVIVCANPAEALAEIARFHGQIDLLLTDVAMPGMDGFALAEKVRKSLPKIPVLFISGYPESTATWNGELPPQSAYLTKPFTPAGLQARLHELLGRKDGVAG
jgi:two-component system cell cycle sensor histidine kinase/response regulator CckA